MYNFLWQYMTVYDFVFFLPCPTLSDSVLLWMTLYDLIQLVLSLAKIMTAVKKLELQKLFTKLLNCHFGSRNRQFPEKS